MSREAKEVWKDSIIPKYLISNLGHVKTKKTGRILKPQLMHTGYHRVCLRDNDLSKKYIYVHRLVAHSFLSPLPKGMQVNHKDCNKTNNATDNLEYLTLHQNLEHGWANGKKCQGDSHGRRKLSSMEVKEIINFGKCRVTRKYLALRYGVSISSISRIWNSVSWTCLKPTETKGEK